MTGNRIRLNLNRRKDLRRINVMNPLDKIADDVASLAKKINTPKDYFPTFGATRDWGQPHIEVDKNFYHFVVVERGEELQRKSTKDYQELLYWIFAWITFQMAFDYELKNRV